MRNSILFSRSNRLVEEIATVPYRSFDAGHDQSAGDREHLFPRFSLNFLPELIRPQHQGYILQAFPNGLPRNAAISMRRSIDVRRKIPIDSEYGIASFRQLIDCRAAHRP